MRYPREIVHALREAQMRFRNQPRHCVDCSRHVQGKRKRCKQCRAIENRRACAAYYRKKHSSPEVADSTPPDAIWEEWNRLVFIVNDLSGPQCDMPPLELPYRA